MRIVLIHNICYILANQSLANMYIYIYVHKTLYIADIETDIPPPRETSQKERQEFKNNHFVFLKNISYTLESVKLRLFKGKNPIPFEIQSKLSSPTVQSNCPVQLSSPTVQSNCPVQLSSPVQSMFCTMPSTDALSTIVRLDVLCVCVYKDGTQTNNPTKRDLETKSQFKDY